MSSIKIIQSLLRNRRALLSFSPSLLSLKRRAISLIPPPSQLPSFGNPCLPPPPTQLSFSCATLRFLNTSISSEDVDSSDEEYPLQCETSEEGEMSDGWEEEDEAEPRIGDGGDGGGVVLQGVPWGQQALSIAQEVLKQFSDVDMELFSFKTTPRGYVYVRLDKLTNKYGCPSMEELESFSQEYKKRLEEIPENLALEIKHDFVLKVSSPGAERILKVPDDLDRFKDMPIRVCYAEDLEFNHLEKDGVFLLESIEEESESCVWKLADVKDNRDLLGKGRPLSRKQKDWRLNLPFNLHRRVTLYLD
ncbi:Ribosome maturation factor RimP [Senna tora]|uniref:Ribosome maturation factor RimP n=1 Tax=Senna tora TaxID=362788 RepID=A0A834WQD8_9FABA|nr:Ribosome maturation factor RimP [Senna tora]